MTERKELPNDFCLTDEQVKEIETLVNALHDKCREYEAPFMVAICVGRNGEESQVAEANYFNGERTPTCMALACHVVDKNISNKLDLLFDR